MIVNGASTVLDQTSAPVLNRHTPSSRAWALSVTMALQQRLQNCHAQPIVVLVLSLTHILCVMLMSSKSHLSGVHDGAV